MKKTFLLYCLLLLSFCLNIYLIFVQSTQHWLNTLMSDTRLDIVASPKKFEKSVLVTKPNLIKSNTEKERLNSSAQALMLIETAIESHDYNNAILLLESLPVSSANRAKKFWLQESQKLINQERFNEAEHSILTYLDYVLDDIDFHYLYIDVLRAQHLFKEAIEHAYSVQYYLYDIPVKNSSINHARMLSQSEIDKYFQQENWMRLSRLCEELLLLDPQNVNLYWFLAQAEYQQGFYEEALASIEMLLEEPNFAIKAKALQDEIQQALQSPSQIPLIKRGEHFFVKGYVNDSDLVSLLIDTGASFSMLSQERFDKLSQYQEVTYIKTLTLNTAGGIIQADLYQVERFTVGDFYVDNMQFTVSPMFSSEDDGLLGMNFLRLFKFTINQNNQTLTLENK